MTQHQQQPNLDAIEARANAATPGPWMADGHEIYGSGCGVPDIDQWKAETLRIEDPEGAKADAEFIAHAREDVPALVAEVRRLREQLALATVLEIPRPGHALPIQLRRSYGHTDRWAICDREGRRWHREHGWVYEAQSIRDEAQRDTTRFTLAEARPLAEQIATAPTDRSAAV